MGLRFRRSIRLIPGVRLNLGLKSLSLSFGPRGAHYTIGTKGTRFTAGIPGTGLSSTHYEPHSRQSGPPLRTPPTSVTTVRPGALPWIVLALLLLGIVVLNLPRGDGTRQVPARSVMRVQAAPPASAARMPVGFPKADRAAVTYAPPATLSTTAADFVSPEETRLIRTARPVPLPRPRPVVPPMVARPQL